MHPRYLTPSVSTLGHGWRLDRCCTLAVQLRRAGNMIADSVTALGWLIAFYYGLTGFACAWYYRKNSDRSARDLWVQGHHARCSAELMLFFALAWTRGSTGDTDCTGATRVGACRSRRIGAIGGVFLIGVLTVHRWARTDVRSRSRSSGRSSVAKSCRRRPSLPTHTDDTTNTGAGGSAGAGGSRRTTGGFTERTPVGGGRCAHPRRCTPPPTSRATGSSAASGSCAWSLGRRTHLPKDHYACLT